MTIAVVSNRQMTLYVEDISLGAIFPVTAEEVARGFQVVVDEMVLSSFAGVAEVYVTDDPLGTHAGRRANCVAPNGRSVEIRGPFPCSPNVTPVLISAVISGTPFISGYVKFRVV